MLKIGQMIKSMRESERVKRAELCRGLCTEATMCKYESGDLIPDCLFFYTVIQRLGKDPGRIYVMISSEEADYFQWKEETATAIEEKAWERLEELLEEYEKETTKINPTIQEQYETYIRALLMAQKGESTETELRYLKHAIECTIPEFETTDWSRLVAGADEINMVLYYLYRRKMNGQKVSRKVVECLGSYIEGQITDSLEKAVIYPRFVCAKRILLDTSVGIEERVREEEKALELLKKVYRIYDLPQILRFLAEDMRKLRKSEWENYERQGKALENVMEKYGHPYEFRLECWYDTRQRMYVINQQLRANRLQLGISQEKLSEDVCTVEHYSRIENGRKKPSRKNYTELAKRLGIGWGYFGGSLITDKFELYEKMTNLRGALIRKDWESANEFYEELEEELDMTVTENVQIMGMMRHIIDNKHKDEPDKSNITAYRELLTKTLPEGKVIRGYTTTEQNLIYHILIEYKKMGMYEQAFEILEEVMENCRKQTDKGGMDIILMKNLYGSMLNDVGRYEESIAIEQEALQDLLHMQCGILVGGLVYGMEENKRGGGFAPLTECMEMVRWSMQLSELYGDKENIEIMQRKYDILKEQIGITIR